MLDHERNLRIGQRSTAPTPGVQVLLQANLPPEGFHGQVVFLYDISDFRVFDAIQGEWMSPAGGGGGEPGGGGNTTIVSDTAPVADQIGDAWLNTVNNQMYVWNGTQWVAVVDPDADAAALAASDAMAQALLARGLAADEYDTFYATVAPTSAAYGDLWVKTDSNTLYRYVGDPPTWVQLNDSALAKALNDAGTAQATADGKITSYHLTWANAQLLGLDAEDDGDLLFCIDRQMEPYRWDGTGMNWVSIRDGQIQAAATQAESAFDRADDAFLLAEEAKGLVDQRLDQYYSETPPWPDGDQTQDEGKHGDLWFQTSTGNAFSWRSDTFTWVLTDTAITTAMEKASTAEIAVDGKVSAFYSATAPVIGGTGGATEGDIWYQTNNGNLTWYVLNSNWTQLPKGSGAIGAGAIGNGHIAFGAITADKISATAIDGKTITGATIQTSSANFSSVRMTSSGIFAYNSGGYTTFSATTGGVVTVAGTVTSNASSGSYVKLDSTNHRLQFYDSSYGTSCYVYGSGGYLTLAGGSNGMQFTGNGAVFACSTNFNNSVNFYSSVYMNSLSTGSISCNTVNTNGYNVNASGGSINGGYFNATGTVSANSGSAVLGMRGSYWSVYGGGATEIHGTSSQTEARTSGNGAFADFRCAYITRVGEYAGSYVKYKKGVNKRELKKDLFASTLRGNGLHHWDWDHKAAEIDPRIKTGMGLVADHLPSFLRNDYGYDVDGVMAYMWDALAAAYDRIEDLEMRMPGAPGGQ